MLYQFRLPHSLCLQSTSPQSCAWSPSDASSPSSMNFLWRFGWFGKIMPHFIMPKYIHFSAALRKISRGIWKEYSLSALIDFIPQVHYPVPESLASLVWGQAGRLLSAIFLGMFRCLSTLSLTEMIIISCQLGGGWDCRGGELDELLPGHLHRSASHPTYDGQGQDQN